MEKNHYIPDEALPPKKPEKPKLDRADFTPTFVGTQVQTLDLKALEKQAKSSQKLYRQGRIGQSKGKVIFKNGPICVFFLGDVHYGSVFCDYDRFEKEVTLIKDTPGAYIVWMANLIDNAIPAQFPNNLLNNVMPPDKQVVALRKINEELNAKHKVLGAVTSPCHEGWTWKHTGQDINALIFGFSGRKFPILDNGGELSIKIGKVTYLVYLYHQVGPFESNFNETHALRQMNRLNLRMKGDVLVGAHKHVAAAQLVYEGSGKNVLPVAYIRTGTYKLLDDQFSIARYGTTGEPSAQSVILWPDERKIAVNLEFDLGLKVYTSL